MTDQVQSLPPKLARLRGLYSQFEVEQEDYKARRDELLTNTDASTISRLIRGEAESYKKLQEIKKAYESLFQDIYGNQPKSISETELPARLKLPSRKLATQYQPIPIVLRSSALMTFAVLALRFFGGLQTLELFFYDKFMQSQKPEPDERILVVGMTQTDYEEQRKRDGGEPIDKASLSNQTLSRLLTKLEKFDPIAVGLDIQRDQDLDSQLAQTVSQFEQAIANTQSDQDKDELKDELNKLYERYGNLEKYFKNGSLKTPSNPEDKNDGNLAERSSQQENKDEEETKGNLFAICKANDDQDKNSSRFPPPPDISTQQVGFADFPSVDSDGSVLRRNLLAFKHSSPDCANIFTSFGLVVANHYLNSQGEAIQLQEGSPFFKTTSDGEECEALRFTNDISLPNFQPVTGGYQGDSVDSPIAGQYGGCQILLKYRGYDESDVGKNFEDDADEPFKTFSVEEILRMPDDKEEIDQAYKDRIILIGVNRYAGGNDNWLTPYGTIPGVIVQAHMISQILDAVSLEEGQPRRSLIRVLPQWKVLPQWNGNGIEVGEIAVIWVSSVLGGVLGIAPLLEGILNRFGLGRFARYLRVPFWFLVILVVLPLIYYWISALAFASRMSLWLPFAPSVLVLWLTSGLVVLRTRSFGLMSGEDSHQGSSSGNADEIDA